MNYVSITRVFRASAVCCRAVQISSICYRVVPGCSLLLLLFMALADSTFAQQPLFESETVNDQTTGHAIPIDVDITGATDLYLVVDDVGGYNFDWCDWVDPVLTSVDGKQQKLTELDWKAAYSGYGHVNKFENCSGGALKVEGKTLEDGIGTHAPSVIHYELPAGFTKFTATGALDDGGVGQGGWATTSVSVQFKVFTEKPPAEYYSGQRTGSEKDHEIENVLTQFDVHPELDLSLFAAEPMLVNPSNIDVDHLGRVWVCEVMNYRWRKDTRPEGDRLLILEDTDGNGRADKQTVFYQGSDIDSLHGVCVLGDRALVSAGSEVFFLIDSDGDSKADKKEVLFTGIGGVQHDHGIHAFVFGPDGKFYFNFGNEGRQICDKDGKVLVDVAGQEVSTDNYPYKQGMVFRCNPDGSEFETLAWNFRNNWELCVDSFGRMWQSDNDDDGNRAVRINYVMPFGNYGFKDEMTGAGWQTKRTGMAQDVPSRHWYQNDPGVIPNMLQTGAGSPTGICAYEGDALPEVFRNEIIHCDAGPNVVRCYPVTPDGAGYQAGIVNLMDGSEHNKWFRPSDVCVAPDGSLIVADWYDPGVGGHQMGDIEHGRLFRLTAKGTGNNYTIPTCDFSTPRSACKALASPNMATRYMAWNALRKFDEDARDALSEMAGDSNRRLAARAAWLLSKMNQEALGGIEFSGDAWAEPEVTCALIRMAFQMRPEDRGEHFIERLAMISVNESPIVRREVLTAISRRALYAVDENVAAVMIGYLADSYPVEDRWYLEALGIACDGRWDEMQRALSPGNLKPMQRRDIIWRSRFSTTPAALARTLMEDDLGPGDAMKFMRAFDFFPGKSQEELRTLAAQVDVASGNEAKYIFVESVGRLPRAEMNEELLEKLGAILDTSPPEEFVGLVERFELSERSDRLYELAMANGADQIGIDSARALARVKPDYLSAKLESVSDEEFALLASIVERVRISETTEIFKAFALDGENELERRKRLVISLAQARPGAEAVVRWVDAKRFDSKLKPAISAALHSSRWDDIVQVGQREFPLPASKDSQPPAIRDLVKLKGDVANGLNVFRNAGTCAKCHIVAGEGVEVGPDLTEIGSKLSRQAMFESILFPSAGISHGYEQSSIQTADGDLLSGIIISETGEFVELKDKDGVVRKIPTGEIEGRKPQKLSIMPADLHKELTDQDLADLVEYLMELKK